jgi:DNA-binding phage protein
MTGKPDPLPAIAQAVRDELARTDGTIAGLARDAGVSRAKVSEWLGGKQWVSPATLAAILEAMNLELVVRRRRPK